MVRLKRTFSKLSRGLDRLEEAFLCLLLLGMIGLAIGQIFLRLAFASGFIWAEPLLRYLVLWAGLFGAAVATRQKKHITIDIASHLVPARLTPWLVVLLNAFAAMVCAALTYAAIIFVHNEAAFDEGRQLLGLASWQLNLIFPLAFALMALRFAAAAGRKSRGPSPDGPV